MNFVDVIIPLALPKLLTYRVPPDLKNEIYPGIRVIVPLAGNKLYTALVRRAHDKEPQGYDARELNSVLDEKPIVSELQFQFWEWISNYYMCTLGEVMHSALPSSLKLTSESKIVLNQDYEGQGLELKEKEFILFDALQIRKNLSFPEIADILGIQTIHPIVKSLVEKGIVIPEEELRYRYKPKFKTVLRLGEEAKDETALQSFFDYAEKRAPRQSVALMTFLKEAGMNDPASFEMDKKKLMDLSGASLPIINSLVKKDIFELENVEINRVRGEAAEVEGSKSLSDSQMEALSEIRNHWKSKDAVLLHGVTSSGKTEIYVKLIEEQLELGKQVLYLLPEIALTTQIIQRLQVYFGEKVGVYHSRFNLNERAEIWQRTQEEGANAFQVILGARSSLFLPYRNLGLIIVDEEHENTFKQQDPAPRYHARDMSIILAKMFSSKVLLASATPSVESYWNAKRERYGLVELNERFGGVQMPEIFCADLRTELKEGSMKGNFSSLLIQHMEATFEVGEQVILFQNRRGYAPLWQCQVCGWIPGCPRCDVSLTYHKHKHHLKCHYCSFEAKPSNACPACGSKELKMLGFGTEKIEEELEELFPGVKVGRLDLDTTRSKNAYQNLLGEFDRGEIQVLVGTQMVTKGLDFDHVGLVGILNADQMLKFPDFRSFERSYQLMSQVAGRAGRKKKRGKVIIQTFTPTHWVIQKVIEHNYIDMFDQEILERKNFHYPPFYRLIRLTVKHRKQEVADRGSEILASRMRKVFGDRVLGPERPYVSRINLIYLVQIMLKLERDASPAKVKEKLQEVVELMLDEEGYKSLRINIDVDPI